MTKVYFKKSWGMVFMISAVVLLALHGLLYKMTGEIKWLHVIASCLIGIAGALYYFRVYFKYDKHQIVLYSPFGFVTRRYLFDKYTQLVLSGGKLYQVKRNKRKRVWLSRIMIEERDWKIFLNAFFEDDLSGELHDIT